MLKYMLVAQVVKMMENIRLGGEVGDKELLTRRDEIYIDAYSYKLGVFELVVLVTHALREQHNHLWLDEREVTV